MDTDGHGYQADAPTAEFTSRVNAKRSFHPYYNYEGPRISDKDLAKQFFFLSPRRRSGERTEERILRNKTSRFEPLNRQRRVGLGVLTPPRSSDASSMPGGGVRTPSPTFRFVESLHLQQSDAHWDHEPPLCVWCPRFSVFRPPDTLKGGHQTLRFMERVRMGRAVSKTL